ncbi:ATP synthase F1 subunit delta [Flavobacterium difficile]|uniref:ATP synthase subunit delta n=1 Tax=Flavobacterium difficile TaxID=2709659 RepID=A0ABX0I1J6_9FLAO|nr:ATP synthase F1 subunit delta [Flavobacterium difficile]NHM00566.1 ATP synthase F1 subunit delta [Flavobacterium difficile]
MSRAAIRYAKAILDIATESNTTSAVNNDMKTIVTAINESEELKDFLSNPIVNDAVKMNALSEIFPSLQTETKGLFQLLLANKRFEILGAIALQFNNLFDLKSGVEQAVVTTAVPLTAELEAQVLNKLKEFSSNSISITNIIDASIIGGFVIRIGDKQYNASVANKLQQLKREFTY